jgi:chitodextrinase
LRGGTLGVLLAGIFSVAGVVPVAVSAATVSPFTVATSASAVAYQRSAQDKVAYLHDGSLLVAYFDSTSPGGAKIKQVTNPSTSPVSKNVLSIPGGDEATIYTLPGNGSTDIWIQVGSELFGLPKLEQVQHGIYNGSTFTWDSAYPIPGALTTGRQDPSLTWTGQWLIATWWDDTVGGNSDNIFYNWTADMTGASGWAVTAKSGTINAATLAAATTIDYNLVSGAAPVVGDWFQIGHGNNCPCDAELRQVTAVALPVGSVYTLTVAALTNAHVMGDPIRVEAKELVATATNSVQVSIRHSARLGATIAVYGAHTHVYSRTLLDSKTDPSSSNWSTEKLVDSGFDDSENNFGGPQIAIDENNGNIHVFKAVTNSQGSSWHGVTYWLGHMSGTGTITWNSRVVIDSAATTLDPPDIAGAVDSTGKVYIFWATSMTGGAIKTVTLVSPYLSANVSAATTVATTGTNPRYPHVPAQAPLTGGYVPMVYQSGSSNPYSIILETRYPDTVPPTVPTGLSATAATGPVHVNLSWNASTDNLAVSGYTIYRNGSPLTTVSASTLTYADMAVTAGTHYSYSVDAFDAAGNRSAQSAPVGVNTQDIAPPSVPTGLGATPTFTHQVNLSWNASTDDVGVTGYTIYRNGSPLTTVSGATLAYADTTVLDLTSYSYTVDAFDAAGNHSAQSAPASATTPDTSGTYHPLSPLRVLDTRFSARTLGAGGSLNLALGGISVPGNATAVVLNVTATNTSTMGFLTVYPAGGSVPLASNLNWVAHETVPNLVMVRLGSGGLVTIFNGAGSADVVVDLEGYFAPPGGGTAGGFVPLTPSRVTDTRPFSGQANAGLTLGPGGRLDVQITGAGGVPATGAAAAVLNVTVTHTSSSGFITAYPTGSSMPLASNLNWTAGETVPNRVIVPIGTGGKVTFYNGSGSADLLVDVNGYFTDSSASGSVFVGVPPSRIVDTRFGIGALSTPVGPGAFIPVTVAGVGGVPAMGSGTTPRAVVVNVTVTNPTSASFLTVWPSGTSMPLSSDLNFVGRQTVPNLVVVQVGTDGKIDVFNSVGSTDVVVDIVGWFG